MRLALRLLMREGRAGELAVLGIALLLAVAAVTSVSFFTDRVEQALGRQAGELLAADLVRVSDHPPDGRRESEARRFGLSHARALTFPSMVVAGGHARLAEIKAVSAGYPLRGRLIVGKAPSGPGIEVQSGPAPGTAWADARLMQQLGLTVGDTVEVGRLRLPVTAVLLREPDRAGDFFALAPRLMMHEADIGATGLITAGSRLRHRLLLAGEAKAVEAYRRWAEPRLERGERLEGVQDARPEIRSALDRARRYLGLAALMAAVLAGVAVSMASRRFVERNLDACAVMRCLGASQGRIFRLYLVQFLCLGLAGGALGALTGLAAQGVLARLLAARLEVSLPPPGPLPFLEGVVLGVGLLLAFGAVPLLRLARVPTLRVLRRELAPPGGLGLAGYLAGAAAVVGMLLWKAQDPRLGAYVGGGLAILFAAAWLAATLLVLGVGAWRDRARGVWFYGLTNLTRRRASSRLQIVALSLGLMALLLLGLVRGDLLASWQRALPRDAPNRFLINVQPEQVAPLASLLASEGLAPPRFYPMVRGRLVAINGRPVAARDYADEQSRRLVEREFNLSWAEAPPPDNRIVAGRFWRGREAPPQWSVEKGIAERLGIRLHDLLAFDVAGTRIEARVSSLREVDWDSMRVNFFVIGTPGLLSDQSASHITSFHLPPGREAVLDRLVRAYPNVTVIDVAAILQEVRSIMERVTRAVEFVFLFTVAAGLAVLYAAVVASRDERVHEAAVMRALGARRAQLRAAQWIEFAVIGALSGLLAATGAAAAAWLLAREVLNLPFAPRPALWLLGMAAGAVGVALAGALATRRVLHVPPVTVLRG